MIDSNIRCNFRILDVICCKRNSTSITTINRNTHVFSIRTEGNAEFKYNNKTYYINENNILFIPKGSKYTQHTTSETIIAIHFEGDIDIDEMTVFYSQNKNLFSAFNDIYLMWNTPTKANTYKIYSAFYNILSELQSIYDCPIPQNKVSKGYYYLLENYTNPDITINSIARDLKITPAYFRKEFKAMYGTSPKEKLINLRLEKSIFLIRNKYCNIQEAALQCGFNNPSYFSTLFKKKYGISPSTYSKFDI